MNHWFIFPRSSIACKLASIHQEQHIEHIKHLENLKDEIELKEFKEEPIDDDVIDALSMINCDDQDQIKPQKEDIENTSENLDGGSDGGYVSMDMTDSISSETSDFTPYNSSDDSLIWPSEVKRKIDIYVKPIDDSLSMINMDGRSIHSEDSMDLAQPHFVDFLPLAFTAIV